MRKIMNELNQATIQYAEMVTEIVHSGMVVQNARTGVSVRQCADKPYVFSIWLYNYFQLLQNRQYYLHVAAAETAWQLMGTEDASFINRVAPKLWSKFTKEDGTISNAQGFRWRQYFGRDQIIIAIDRICNHPTDRQIIVSSWHPGVDGLGRPQANTHCLPLMQFQVSSKRQYLNLTVYSRSADMILGFPYDVYNYSFLLYAMAASCKLRAGYLNIVFNNYHIYWEQDHIDIANTLLSDDNMAMEQIFQYPTYTISDIISFPHKYISWVKSNMRHEHPYKPSAEIVI